MEFICRYALPNGDSYEYIYSSPKNEQDLKYEIEDYVGQEVIIIDYKRIEKSIKIFKGKDISKLLCPHCNTQEFVYGYCESCTETVKCDDCGTCIFCKQAAEPY